MTQYIHTFMKTLLAWTDASMWTDHTLRASEWPWALPPPASWSPVGWGKAVVLGTSIVQPSQDWWSHWGPTQRGGRACFDLQAPRPLQILLCDHLHCPSVSLSFLVAKPWTQCTETLLEAHYLPFQGTPKPAYDSDTLLLWSPRALAAF